MSIFPGKTGDGPSTGRISDIAGRWGRDGGYVFRGLVTLALIGAALYPLAGIIQTGNVGVRTPLGTVGMDEVDPGIKV